MFEIKDLKPYIKLNRSCKIKTNKVLLESYQSLISLDFSELNPETISLFLKRGSGSDGKVIINEVEYYLPPNKEKEICVKELIINIRRLFNSGGAISLSKVILNEEDLKEDSIMMTDTLPDFLTKIGKTKGIKRTSIGLMAGEFAEIDNAQNISFIETDPPSSFKKINDKIIFIHPCRILKINMSDDIIIQKNHGKLHVSNLLNDYKNIVPIPVFDKSIVKELQSNVVSKAVLENKSIENKVINEIIDDIVYDSGILNVSAAFNSSSILQAQNSIKVNQDGRFFLPVSKLKPNTEYVFIISASRGSGNGKLSISISTTSGKIRSGSIIIAGSKSSINLNTGNAPPDGETYCLLIDRPSKSSTGDIYISNIKIKSSTNLNNLAPVARSKNNQIVNDKKIKSKVSLLANKNFNPILRPDLFTSNKVNTISKSVLLTDYENSVWYNRMRSGLSLNYCSQDVLYEGEGIKSGFEDVCLCGSDYIPDCKRIFISEYSKHLSVNSLLTISNCSEILTPSLYNYLKLKQVNDNVKRCVLPWLYMDGSYKRNDYIIYFDCNLDMTLQLLNEWKFSYPKLMLVSSNFKTSGNIETVLPTESYQVLHKLIVESSSLIYIHNNTHHDSGLVNLAKHTGVNIISNNIHYYNDQIIRTDNDKVTLDKLSFIKNDKPVFIDQIKYNDYIDNNLKILVGDK